MTVAHDHSWAGHDAPVEGLVGPAGDGGVEGGVAGETATSVGAVEADVRSWRDLDGRYVWGSSGVDWNGGRGRLLAYLLLYRSHSGRSVRGV